MLLRHLRAVACGGRAGLPRLGRAWPAGLVARPGAGAERRLGGREPPRPARDAACGAGLAIGRPYSAGPERPAGFEDMGLLPSLMNAVRAAGFAKPTEIQALAVPAIAGGGDFLLCSQTGSGKTLAYLLPVVQRMKQLEDGPDAARRAKRPKVVVLGPTKELTEQITAVAKTLCHHAKFRAVCCNSNASLASQAAKLAGPVDMVVATPQRLRQLLDAGSVALGDVQWLVIDEADTMFDQGFGEDVGALLGILRAKAAPAQAVLVSATMTKAVKRLADAQLPGLLRLEAAGFHRPTATARHDFRVLPPGGDKLQLLQELLAGDAARRRKVLVFCGSVDSVRAVEHCLSERGLPVVCYHGDMPLAARKDAMAAFAGSSADAGADAPCIMVASDLAARGLDFPGTIDHVVNFDFPSNAIDFLHRSGRTARAGATGRVTSLLGPRDRRLAAAIQYALDKGLPLDQVTASGAAPAPPPAGQAGEAGAKHSPAKRAKAQEARWNPEHKFLHLRDGQPIVPFKELLAGKGGDERKRLLYEIALDVKEWRRWRHARAVARAAKRRAKDDAAAAAPRGGGGGGGGAPRRPAEPEERWKAKVAQKRRRQQQEREQSGPGRGRQQQQQQRRGK
ncbi:DEAD-box ATP-dependent RNA helicase 39 [Scenedesmus sp. PABB004]|nr:DEAD-box ATP-dependent RNA helicase 39 [Scenedesmus sp. PABB004]